MTNEEAHQLLWAAVEEARSVLAQHGALARVCELVRLITDTEEVRLENRARPNANTPTSVA